MRILIRDSKVTVNSKEIEVMLRVAIEQVCGQRRMLQSTMNFQIFKFQNIFIPKMHYFLGPKLSQDLNKFVYGSSFSHDKSIFVKNSDYARDQFYESYGNLKISAKDQNVKITFLFETLVAPSRSNELPVNTELFFKEQGVKTQLDVIPIKTQILEKGLLRNMMKTQPSQTSFEGAEYEKLESGILVQSEKKNNYELRKFPGKRFGLSIAMMIKTRSTRDGSEGR